MHIDEFSQYLVKCFNCHRGVCLKGTSRVKSGFYII